MAYQLLDPREEEDLFKTRLLNVEEKPFKRITKRLALLSRVAAQAVQEHTPPPEGPSDTDTTTTTETTSTSSTLLADIAQLREDVTLDFAAFDSSIARLQFLSTANASERQGYAARRETVATKCDSVKAHMLALRAQLEQARATLAQRQDFDALADRITASKTLWPRADQAATIAKLEDECRQLQGESELYRGTWVERRQQFARIMDESMKLRRQIRDEADEVERREGMDEEGEGGQQTAQAGTPAATTATAAATTAAAPATTTASATPTEAATTPATAAATLAPETALAPTSREPTPAVVVVAPDEDLAMANDGTPDGTPDTTDRQADTDKMDTT